VVKAVARFRYALEKLHTPVTLLLMKAFTLSQQSFRQMGGKALALL